MTVSPERLDQMQAGWVRLLAGFGVEPAAAYPVFDHLVAAYSEPHRHYHTLEHIHEVHRVAGKLADVANDIPGISLAIWFHDAVYEPREKDNEERSAVLAGECLGSLGIPRDRREKVMAMIRATAHMDMVDVDADVAVLLDSDLAILSAEKRRYARYAADVRREYSWVDEKSYRAGRAQVLQHFLKRPRIFRTERMYTAAESAARANLQEEIVLLSTGPET